MKLYGRKIGHEGDGVTCWIFNDVFTHNDTHEVSSDVFVPVKMDLKCSHPKQPLFHGGFVYCVDCRAELKIIAWESMYEKGKEDEIKELVGEP